MKRIIFRSVFAVLVLALMLPHNSTFAATSTAVKTKILNYKGQKYVQLTGGIKSVTDKINKEMKNHATDAAKINSDMKKEDASYSYFSVGSVKYNKNERLSVVYIDAVYTGGAHELFSAYTYNYDLRTGKLITLGDIVSTDSQIKNLVVSISSNLKKLQLSGKAIFDENLFDFPIAPDSPFYFYDSGIVITFEPYVVAPFSEGFIDVKVPYSVINAVPFAKSSPNVPPVTSNYIETQIDDDFEGYDEGNLYELSNGQIWKQVDYNYSYSYAYRPDVVIFKDGTRYYMIVDGMKDKIEVERIK